MYRRPAIWPKLKFGIALEAEDVKATDATASQEDKTQILAGRGLIVF